MDEIAPAGSSSGNPPSSAMNNFLSMPLDEIIKQRKQPAKVRKSSKKEKKQERKARKQSAKPTATVQQGKDRAPDVAVNVTQGVSGGVEKKRRKRRAGGGADLKQGQRTGGGVNGAANGRQAQQSHPHQNRSTDKSNGGPVESKRGAGNKTKGRNGVKSTAGCRILVSNLNMDVTEEDIKELFAAVGPLVSANLVVGGDGGSAKRADVVFAQMAHAVEAISRYNGVPLDHMPLRITLATERSAAAVSSSARGSIANPAPRPSRTTHYQHRGGSRG